MDFLQISDDLVSDLLHVRLISIITLFVLPKALFGCELWHNMSRSDMRQLEIAHHFCLKHSHGLQHDTRSDMVEGMPTSISSSSRSSAQSSEQHRPQT